MGKEEGEEGRGREGVPECPNSESASLVSPQMCGQWNKHLSQRADPIPP